MSAQAGGIDWVARWREMLSAVESAAEKPGGPGEDRWSRRAARFDRMSRERHDAALDALAAAVLPTDTVADIGAGTGRHAIPLARACYHVLAIEPSAAMRERLIARAADEQTSNTTIVPEGWPCAAPTVDVALSSHVLYGIADVAPFLEQMTRVARRSCLLVLGLRAPADALASLRQAIHGRIQPPRPAALEALAVLHQLGHEANLRVIPGSTRALEYSATDDDLDELCHRLGVAADHEGRSRVRAEIDRLHGQSPDRSWVLGASGPNALIDWPGTAP